MNDDVTTHELVNRVADLEQRVGYLEQLMNVRPPGANSPSTVLGSSPDVDAMWQESDLTEVRGLVRSGKKIEAIKRYRELKHTGLQQAKDAVEAMERGQ